MALCLVECRKVALGTYLVPQKDRSLFTAGDFPCILTKTI
jgi:hypothetical protein